MNTETIALLLLCIVFYSVCGLFIAELEDAKRYQQTTINREMQHYHNPLRELDVPEYFGYQSRALWMMPMHPQKGRPNFLTDQAMP